VNFRESFGDAEGLTLPQLYHKHRHAGVRAEMVVYEAVRQVTIGQQGAEARTLCRWSAMLRHKARVEWVLKYWASALGPPCPAANEPYMLVYDSSTEPNGDNVAGWALVDGRNKCAHGPADTCACELQMEWDVGVWEADVPGCGCKGGTREPCAGRCSCKGGNGAAAHQCGPMCRCLGGARCRNNNRASPALPTARTSPPAAGSQQAQLDAARAAHQPVLTFAAAADARPMGEDTELSGGEESAEGGAAEHMEEGSGSESEGEGEQPAVQAMRGQESDDDEDDDHDHDHDDQDEGAGSDEDAPGEADEDAPVSPFLGVE
jgi:hypothetical protein